MTQEKAPILLAEDEAMLRVIAVEMLEDAGFEVFLTADQNLQFQQNLIRTPLRVIVLAASSNALEDLLPR